MNFFKKIFSRIEKGPDKKEEEQKTEESLTTKEKIDFVELFDKGKLEQMQIMINKEEDEEKKKELKALRLKLMKKEDFKEFSPEGEQETRKAEDQSLSKQREFLYKKPGEEEVKDLIDNLQPKRDYAFRGGKYKLERIAQKEKNDNLKEAVKILEKRGKKKEWVRGREQFQKLSPEKQFLVYRWLKEEGKLDEYSEIEQEFTEQKKLECKLVLDDLKGILQRAVLEKSFPDREVKKPENEQEIIDGLRESLIRLPLGEEFYEYHKKALVILQELRSKDKETYKKIVEKEAINTREKMNEKIREWNKNHPDSTIKTFDKDDNPPKDNVEFRNYASGFIDEKDKHDFNGFTGEEIRNIFSEEMKKIEILERSLESIKRGLDQTMEIIITQNGIKEEAIEEKKKKMEEDKDNKEFQNADKEHKDFLAKKELLLNDVEFKGNEEETIINMEQSIEELKEEIEKEKKDEEEDLILKTMEKKLANWLVNYKGPQARQWREEISNILREEIKKSEKTEKDKKDIEDIRRMIENKR